MTTRMHATQFEYGGDRPVVVHLKTGIQGYDTLEADSVSTDVSGVTVDFSGRRYLVPWFNVAGITQDLPKA